MVSIVRAVQEWLNGCPYLTDFTGGQHIDWTDSAPGNYGLAPTGNSVVESLRTSSATGPFTSNITSLFTPGTGRWTT